MPCSNGFRLYREFSKRDDNAKYALCHRQKLFDTTSNFSPVYPFIRKPVENKN